MRFRFLAALLVFVGLGLALTLVVLADGAAPGWLRVNASGFGDSSNQAVSALAGFNGLLYAGTSRSGGAQLWRQGNDMSWTAAVTNGFGDPHNAGAPALEVFRGYLYAGTSSVVWPSFSSTGGEVWRTSDGTIWTQVNADGFGTVSNTAISALAAFNDYLYASTLGVDGHGCQVWRCQTCRRNPDWTMVVDNGFGNSHSYGPSALKVFSGRLYCVVGNRATGLEVWRTTNGTAWEQVGFVGFGNAKNRSAYWNASLEVLNNSLLVGTVNFAHGGEVWMYLPNRLLLPIVRKP